MINQASFKSPTPKTTQRVEIELKELRSIYELIYAEHAIRYVLYQGEDPVWSHPAVFEGHFDFEAHHVRQGYLGVIERPAPFPGANKVTILISIPRQTNAAENVSTDHPWTLHGFRKAIFAASPLALEQIRFHKEMKRKAASRKVDNYTPIPHGLGSPLLPTPAVPTNTSGRPAILIGFHWLEIGGAEKLAFDCVNWALAAGLRVFVVASVPSVQRLKGKLPDHKDVRFIRTDRYLDHHLKNRFFERLILEENIQMVHIHHCNMLYDALPNIRIFTPWVKVVDSTHIIEYANGGYPRISGVWSNFIDVHHVISKELINFFRDEFGIQNNIRLGRMLDKRDEPAILPPLNLKPNQKNLHISFVGRLHYQKRPIVLALCLKALNKWASANGVALTATLIGDGEFKEPLTRYLKQVGMFDQITILQSSADVPAILSKSDIMLLPSNNEGLALVCYEAIEQGCIPITTDVGSQNEIIPQDLLVPLSPRDCVKQTIRIVEKLMTEPDFLYKQENSLKEMFKALSKDETAEDVMMALYTQLTETPKD